MAHRSNPRRTSGLPVVMLLAFCGASPATPPLAAAPCAPLALRPEPGRPALASALADAVTPRRTAAEIVAALGSPQLDHCAAPHHCLEWLLDDTRGLRIDYDDPCRPPAVFRREAVHSVRRAELAARAGLWVVPQAQIDAVNARAAALGLKYIFGAPRAFYYDGETLTVELTPFFSYQSMAENRPHDDIYCLASKWVGDDLYMLTPEDPHWAFHQSFRNGAFEETRNDPNFGPITWRFERTPEERAGRWEHRFLETRGRWSYALESESETAFCRP